jgi:hypothetical protein
MTAAVNAFREFFKAETGKDWEDRNNTSLPTPKTDNEGNVLPAYEGWYFYESQDNIFTSYLMQAGPSDGIPDNSMSVGRSDTSDESETAVARPEGTVVPEVPAQSEEDSGNNADVESEGTSVNAS